LRLEAPKKTGRRGGAASRYRVRIEGRACVSRQYTRRRPNCNCLGLPDIWVIRPTVAG
jgi:hypothetical protein